MRHDLTLRGYGLILEPLDVGDVGALAALVDDAMWAPMPPPVPGTPTAMADYVLAALDDSGRWPFVVRGAADGEVRGCSSFYDLATGPGRVEIGYTFFGRQFWGGHTNPGAKLLMFSQAFDDWRLHRVALRTSSTNAQSAAAIAKLGAVAEGRLREHRIIADGSYADTLYFAILAAEWPAVRAKLVGRLEHFDAAR